MYKSFNSSSKDSLNIKTNAYDLKSDLSHLYYNISIKNTGDENTTSYIPAFYYEQLAEPILINGSNQYQMTVNRFSIPSSLIPIQIIPIMNNQNDPNKTIYSVSITIGTVTTQAYLLWVPETIYASNVPVAPDQTPTKTQVVSPYYYLYDFNKFITILNTAVKTAITANSNYVSATMAVPYFELNQDLTISLVADAFFDQATTASLLYMNNALSQILSSFYVDYVNIGSPNGADVKFIIKNLGSNRIQKPDTNPTSYVYPPTWLRMTQEYSSLADFNNITRLVFTSNTLPIRSEFTPLAVPFGQVSSNLVNNMAPSYTSIVTDFALSSSNNGVDNLAGNLVYSASGNNCRMIDLLSQSAINIIDLNIYFVDTYDNIYPLLIPFNNSINIKLEFRLKSSNS